jgi:hypothetical protein
LDRVHQSLEYAQVDNERRSCRKRVFAVARKQIGLVEITDVVRVVLAENPVDVVVAGPDQKVGLLIFGPLFQSDLEAVSRWAPVWPYDVGKCGPQMVQPECRLFVSVSVELYASLLEQDRGVMFRRGECDARKVTVHVVSPR